MGVEIITIRRALPDDAPALARVHQEAWRTAYQGIIPHGALTRMIARRQPQWWTRAASYGEGLLVLEFDGQVQGYASFGQTRLRHSTTGEIFELYLAPVFQGAGLGKRLFLAARRALQDRGYSGLVVWALEENRTACEFYARLGGEPGLTAPERYGTVTLKRVAYFWPGRKT